MERIVSEPSKRKYGEEALASFQNQMVRRFGDQYTITFPILLRLAEQKQENFVTELGNTLAQTSLGIRRTDEAMQRVVESAVPNKMPSLFSFQNGIANELSDFDFSIFGDVAFDIAKDIIEVNQDLVEGSVEVVKDVGSGIGDAATFLGKNLKMIVALIVAILLFVGYGYIKKKA